MTGLDLVVTEYESMVAKATVDHPLAPPLHLFVESIAPSTLQSLAGLLELSVQFQSRKTTNIQHSNRQRWGTWTNRVLLIKIHHRVVLDGDVQGRASEPA